MEHILVFGRNCFFFAGGRNGPSFSVGIKIYFVFVRLKKITLFCVGGQSRFCFAVLWFRN